MSPMRFELYRSMRRVLSFGRRALLGWGSGGNIEGDVIVITCNVVRSFNALKGRDVIVQGSAESGVRLVPRIAGEAGRTSENHRSSVAQEERGMRRRQGLCKFLPWLKTREQCCKIEKGAGNDIHSCRVTFESPM